MNEQARISEAEARVMEVLWDHSPRSAAEVIEALAGDTDWNHRTIRTLLRRLVDKGAVSFSEDGRSYLYSATLTRQAYVRSESRSFLSRVFGGNPLLAMAHFVEDEQLSSEELERLQSIVDEKREELP